MSRLYKRIALILTIVLVFQAVAQDHVFPNLIHTAKAGVEQDTQAPTAPTGLAVGEITEDSITLTWNASTDNVGVIGYEVYCNGEIFHTEDTSYTYKGLSQGITYSFMIKAVDAAGNRSLPSEFYDFTMPSNNETIIEEDLNVTQRINENLSTVDDIITDPETYEDESIIEDLIKDDEVDNPWDEDPDEIDESVDEEINNENTKDESGEDADNSIKETEPTNEVTDSLAELNLSVSVATGSSIVLTWNIAGSDSEHHYEIYCNNNKVVETAETSYTYEGTDGENYTFYVVAFDLLGNELISSNIVEINLGDNTPDIEAPTAPVNLTATVVSGAAIVLNWDASTDNIGVTEYEIYQDMELIGTVAGNVTTYTVIGLEPGVEYSYTVRGKDEAGNISDPSNTVRIQINYSELNKVLNLNATVINETTVALSWDAVEEATAYEIEYNETVIATVSKTSYVHTGASDTGNNVYRVRAITNEIKGEWSEPVTIVTQIIIKSGTISKDTVWENTGAIYLVENNLTIAQGATLAIAPGVIVKFKGNVQLTINGNLIAKGEENKTIIFTAEKDAEYGGSDVVNASDYWRGILVTITGKFVGDNVKIKYAGVYNDNKTVGLEIAGGLNLSNSEIIKAGYAGITITSDLDVSICNTLIDDARAYGIIVNKRNVKTGTVVIKDCTLNKGVYNGINVSENGESGLIVEGNKIENYDIGINIIEHGTGTIVINENKISNNTSSINISLNGIKSSNVFEGIGANNEYINNKEQNITLTGKVVNDLVITPNRYVFTSITVEEGCTLTILAGSEFLGTNKIAYMNVYGTLNAIGTYSYPIVFTSIKDKDYYGDGVEVKDDYWNTIYVSKTGEFNGNHLKIKYYDYLYIEGLLKLYNSEISHSYRYGLYFKTNVQPTIYSNAFKKNNDYGIYNANSEIVINATNNYWNSIYGPSVYRQVYDIPSKTWNWKWVGMGDKVGDNINYTPYLGTEINIAQHFNSSKGTYAPTGNYSNQFIDMSVNNLEDTIEFIRSYNSQDMSSSGVFGAGWSFNYQAYIIDYEGFEGIKLVKLPDGSMETYSLNADGTFTANNSRNLLERLQNGSYILTTKNQMKYGFNKDGYLIFIENQKGNRITINVDSVGKPTSVTDYSGNKFILKYDGQRLQSITDSVGRIVRYVYSGNQLVKVINPAGIETHYTYDDKGYLTEIRNGRNELIEEISYISVNGLLKVDKIKDRYGNTKYYSYDEKVGKTIITDQNGRITTQWYDTTFNITVNIDTEGKSTYIEYFIDDGINKYGEIKAVYDRNGNITRYERDSRGNTTKIINPDSGYKLYTYDSKNNLISERDENGNFTYYIYDSTETYLLKVVQPLNGTDVYSATADQSKFAITSYTYYSYREDGVTIKGLMKTSTDPEGNVTTYTYDDFGNIKTITDSYNNVTTYHYNSIGLLLSTLSPKGELTEYTYDYNGNLLTKKTNGGEITRIIYDDLGRKVQEIAPNQNMGSYSDDLGYRYTYYNNGKVKTVTDPENNTTSYTYDLYGNILTETKPNGSITSYEYDVLNRVTKVYIQDDASSEKQLLKSYTYSILSNKNTQKKETIYLNDNETSTTVYDYDYADRLVKTTSPDGNSITTQYNTNGTVYSTTDARSKTTYYQYDGLNRLTEQWVPFADSKYTYKSLTYDRNGNIISESIGVESVSLWGKPATLLTTTYSYDPNNNLISVINPANDRTEYEYDANGNRSKEMVYLSEQETKVEEYEYNHLGKVITMTQYINAGDIYGHAWNDKNELALKTVYTYDANGNLLTETKPNGKTVTYFYDNLDRQISVTEQGLDEYGKQTDITTTFTYDFAGNVLTTTDANGNVTKNIYNQRGLLELTIDAMGGKTAYAYDNAGRLIAKVMPKNYIDGATLDEMSRSVYTYDNMNRIILEQDIYYDEKEAAFKTINAKAYQYDNNGNVIKTLDALGYASGTGSTITEKIKSGYGTINTYNDANMLLTTQSPVSKDNGIAYDIKYTYDATGRKISETNAKNIVTKFYYDGAGRVIKTTIMDGSEKVLQQSTYDGLGNVLTQTDGNGNTTTFTYNRLGFLRSQTTPGDETIGAYTIQKQYNSIGQLVYQKDNMGKVINFTYDHKGQVLSQTEQKEDGTHSITITNAYDKNGNLRYSTDGNGVTTEKTYDGLNRVIQTSITVNGIRQVKTYTYDKNGNQLTTTDWLGNTYTNEYDALNRLVKKINPYGKVNEALEYNDNHVQIRAYDGVGNVTIYTYDKNNRLLSTTDPEGHITSQTYDRVGNIATKKDGNNNTTSFDYDALNRLIKVTNAKGESTSYTYDLNGNKLSQKDGKGNTITYAYNVANLLIKKSDPNAGTDPSKMEQYTYYANGLLKTKTDRNGNTTTYTYDIHGNLLKESVGNEIITYTYDNNKNLLTVTDATGTTIRTYDELGRVLTKKVPNIGTISYEYDITEDAEPGYNIERSIDPRGNRTDKVYDKAGRLVKVIIGNDVTTYKYYDNGNRESIIYNDGTKEEYTYFANNQIKSLVHKRANGSTMDTYRYTYDAAGNQLTKYEVINGIEKGTTTYSYDKLNRLETVTEPNGRVTTYTYDKAGNREKETIVVKDPVTGTVTTTVNTYTYNTQNRLTEITTRVNNVITDVTSYTYDNNGNQLETKVKTYKNGVETSNVILAINIYDLRNQLIQTITADGSLVENSYNGEGYRTVKEVNGNRTYYFYEADKVILEVDASGNQKARNVYGTNLLMRTVDGETYYYLYNGHADVTALVTRDGTVAATYYYEAFGNILEATGNVNNNILYSGYQYDNETGLYYLNARMYDPKIARFLQEDTYTGDSNDPLSLNLYTYCGNNPIRYWDPTGHYYAYMGDPEDLTKEDKEYARKLEAKKLEAKKGTGKTPTTVSKNGLNFIANMEVGKSDLVLDSKGNIVEVKPTVNNTTIGYGYDLTKDPLNLGIRTAKNISQADALDYLTKVSNQFAEKIANSKDISVTLSQQQVDALVALRYNIGALGVVPNLLNDINNYASYSTMQGHIYEYYDSLVQKNKNNEKYLKGWKNRADKILNTYFYGDYGEMPINAVEGICK